MGTQTLNVRLAAICLVVIVLLSGGVCLLHAIQIDRHADRWRSQSEAEEEKGDLKEAIRQQANYVLYRSTDPEGLLRLGSLYDKAHSPIAAVDDFQQALRIAGDSISKEKLHEVRLKLVQNALLAAGSPDAQRRVAMQEMADAHLTELIQESPDDPELLELRVKLLLGKQEYDKACEVCNQILKKSPDRLNTYEMEASILRKWLGRKEDADKLMNKMVEKNPKSVGASEKYAIYLLGKNSYDAALAEVKRLLELSPENSRGLWIAGHCYLVKGNYKTAEDYAKRGIKADKTSYQNYKLMADIEGRLGNHGEVFAVLLRGLENVKGTDNGYGYGELLANLIGIELSEGSKAQREDAEKRIEELRQLRVQVGVQGIPWFGQRRSFSQRKWRPARETSRQPRPALWH